MPEKQVVFVRGGHTDEAFPWMYFHFDPWKDDPIGTVTLVYFDYPEGKRKTWNSWTPKRGSAAPPNPDSEEALAPAVQYRKMDGTLDTGPEKPSVLALYNWVKDQPKESILTLQIFSHGWFKGPVLWAESFETSNSQDDLTDVRDPNDTEFRPRDFFGNNPLSGAEGKKFTDALDPKALVKLWGCNEGRYWPGSTELTGSPWRAMVKRYMRAPRGTRGDAVRNANMQTYLDWVQQSFQFTMASRLNWPIWAGPLGWGSTPWQTDNLPGGGTRRLRYRGKFPPNLKKERWWRISAFFTGQFRRFYKDVLKAQLDATNYVEFKQSWFDDAMATLVAELEPGPVTSPRELQQRLLDRIEQLRSRRG